MCQDGQCKNNFPSTHRRRIIITTITQNRWYIKWKKKTKQELIDWMVFYAAFNSISVISWRQLTLFMLSWVSPVLGWALKCLAQGNSHEKTRGSSAARTQDPWITSQTLYQWATWDPNKQENCLTLDLVRLNLLLSYCLCCPLFVALCLLLGSSLWN